MKAAIIEDELHQQELLESYLAKYFPEIEYVGTAATVTDGVELITRKRPDLIFMDVQLGQDTCFDLLNELKNRTFEIIFTTSYEEYALKAFRLAAVDYLLKPVSINDLKNSINKLLKRDQQQQVLDHVKLLLSNINGNSKADHRIALPTMTGFTLIEIEDIVRCESDNTYTTFYLRDGTSMLISKTLKSCERILSDYTFFRVHNSSLINLRYVKEYIKGEGGIVIMEDKKEVSVSRRRKEDFLRKFSKIKL